jgi:hypothetical protein
MQSLSNLCASRETYWIISKCTEKGIIGSSIQSFQGWPFPEILIYTYQLLVEFYATHHFMDFNRSLNQFLHTALKPLHFIEEACNSRELHQAHPMQGVPQIFPSPYFVVRCHECSQECGVMSDPSSKLQECHRCWFDVPSYLLQNHK